MIHLTVCGVLILFFAWLLIHAFIYSKFNHIIEGLDPAATMGPTTGPTMGPTTGPTMGPTMGPTTGPTPPDQMDENPAQIAIIKKQIASLIDTATQLTTAMNQNEAGIKNNTALIQKVMQSQIELNTKLDSMKKAQ